MTTEKGYNGWTNYETWNVALWIGNEEGSSRYWDERAQEAYDNAEADKTFTREERAALDLMGTLKQEHSNAAQDVLETGRVHCSWIADLLHGALSEVNWHEIAVSLLDNVEKEEEVSSGSQS